MPSSPSTLAQEIRDEMRKQREAELRRHYGQIIQHYVIEMLADPAVDMFVIPEELNSESTGGKAPSWHSIDESLGIKRVQILAEAFVHTGHILAGESHGK